MISRRKIAKIAKDSFKKSLTDGSVDIKKVKETINTLKNQYKSGLTTILKLYKKLLFTSLSKEEVIIEVPENFEFAKNIEEQILEKTGAKRIIYKTNSKLVFGAKITHGDWIFDSSLPAKLSQLTIND